MELSDDSGRVERRASYAAYARLQWELYRLPADHPARAALDLAVAEANRHWRALVASVHTARDVATSAAPTPDATCAVPPARLVHLGRGAWAALSGANRIIGTASPQPDRVAGASAPADAAVEFRRIGRHLWASGPDQPAASDD